MVKKLLINFILENGQRLTKSVINAYTKVAGQSGGGAAAGGANDAFNKMKEQMGVLSGKTMTQDEAKKILNIDSEEEELKPEKIMERFDTLIEKNQVDKGGSFYI